VLSVLVNLITRKQRPSLDRLLEDADEKLAGIPGLVAPAENASPRTSFDAPDVPLEEVSMMNVKGRDRLRVMRRALPLFVDMKRGASLCEEPPPPPAAPADEALWEELQQQAKAWGAKDISYVDVPRDAIFQNKGVPLPHALVFTVEMDKDPIDTAPSLECQLEVMSGYGQLASIARRLSVFLRRRGFAAYPGTALGGVTDYPLLAELAGLGAIGYHGLLISPGEGARLRICTVYTDLANLPRRPRNEHAWVRDFCAMCRRCVRSCPADAIYEQPRPRGNSGRQCIDQGACRSYFTRNFGCAVCVKVCPFSQKGYDKVHEAFKGNPNAPRFDIDPVDDVAP
jgi:epoxyqueuosine reductase